MDINHEIAKLNWDKKPVGLYAPIAYTLEAGGKRIRPRLAMLGANAVAEGKENDVLPAALALEVFHNFTLLHDDVMDKAQVRRGRACVHVKWDENTAILSGDQMMIEAYKLLANVAEDKLPKVLRLFNQMATEICEGQQMDVDLENKSIEESTMDEYMEMIRLKTSVLLANALQTGALMAGASEDQQKSLYRFGIAVGLAFQIQDDLLDCYGNPETFGKAIGGDIREGKKSFMLLTAYRKADSEQKKAFCHDVPTMLKMYDALGVKEEAEQKIEELTADAMHELEQWKENEAIGELKALANQLTHRKS